MDGVAWTNIRDSSGVALADYLFVTDQGGVTDPGATVIWVIVGMEFVGYMVIVTTAIWFIGYVLGFRWADLFGSALRGVAEALTAQIATPVVLVVAASIGAFFVAWFVVRGFPAKATAQILTMLTVAVAGPVFLADPLAHALSADGILAHGRDLGISIAAGLNGSTAEPGGLIATLQADMADGFARRPVQVWNFGHVIDGRPACAAAWSAGMTAGDDDEARAGMARCGDSVALDAMEHSGMGQIGTGLLLLAAAAILLAFAVLLAGRILRATLDAVYHGFRAIFGFAAGGFVYGPTQTALVRDIVDIGIDGVRMLAYTIFLGVYLLFVTDLLVQAQGGVLAVLVIVAVVEIVAIAQLSRLTKGLTRGSVEITNRIARTLQAAHSRGGTTLGTSTAPAGGGGTGLGFVAGLAALNTVNNSPVTAWLAGRTVAPLSPLARGKMHNDRANIATASSRVESYEWGRMARHNWQLVIRSEANRFGGITSELGVSRALKMMGDNRIPNSQLASALLSVGTSDEFTINALRALAVQEASRSHNPYSFLPLQKAVAAGYAVRNHVGDAAQRAFAAQAVVAADGFARHSIAPMPGAVIDKEFVRRVEQNWDSDQALSAAVTADEWNSVGRDTRAYIGRNAAQAHLRAARTYYDEPTAANLDRLILSTRRIANLDHLNPAQGLDPWDG